MLPQAAVNRTRILTIAYPVAAAALLAGSFALMTVGDGGWGLLMFLLLLAVIPVQYAAYRDYFAGRRLLMQGQAQEAIPLLEAFLEKVRRRPALRHLVWLGWAIHTPSIEAMTLNNLGSAAMVLGDMERSEAWLREALRADPRYGIAYGNLSLLAAHRGDAEEAERLMAEARRLGMPASIPHAPEPEQR
jgi:tetratricopeptide (TPR) repeat protein